MINQAQAVEQVNQLIAYVHAPITVGSDTIDVPDLEAAVDIAMSGPGFDLFKASVPSSRGARLHRELLPRRKGPRSSVRSIDARTFIRASADAVVCDSTSAEAFARVLEYGVGQEAATWSYSSDLLFFRAHPSGLLADVRAAWRLDIHAPLAGLNPTPPLEWQTMVLDTITKMAAALNAMGGGVVWAPPIEDAGRKLMNDWLPYHEEPAQVPSWYWITLVGPRGLAGLGGIAAFTAQHTHVSAQGVDYPSGAEGMLAILTESADQFRVGKPFKT